MTMSPYGVKMKGGKILWINADGVESKEGALLFYANKDDGGREVVAGFNTLQVDHFGRKEAFAKDPSPPPKGD